MLRFILPLITLLALLCGAVSVHAQSDTPSLSRGEVMDTVRLMIKDMDVEKPDYSKILQDYGWPEGINQVKEHGEFDRHAKTFAVEIAPQLLKVLKFIQNRAPIRESATAVSFDIKPYISTLSADEKKKLPTESIKFLMVDGKWYLR